MFFNLEYIQSKTMSTFSEAVCNVALMLFIPVLRNKELSAIDFFNFFS